jgi:hypothetical protein
MTKEEKIDFIVNFIGKENMDEEYFRRTRQSRTDEEIDRSFEFYKSQLSKKSKEK